MSVALQPYTAPHPFRAVTGRGDALLARSFQRRVLAVCDLGFMAAIFMFSSDAFMFLGLNSLVWLACYGYLFLRLMISLPQMGEAIRRNWMFFLFPVLVSVSVLWSAAPNYGIRFSIQLMITVMMAVFIGTRFSPRQIFLTFLAMMFLAMLASAMNVTGAITPAYDGRENFKGIFLSKNALGHRAALFAISCTFALMIVPGMGRMWRLVGLTGLLTVTGMLAIAGSATGILFSVGASAGAMALWTVIHWRGAWAFLLAAILAPVAVTLMASGFMSVDPAAAVLGLVGRGTTLTGRTVLWEFGWQHYLDQPWIGYGVEGFWANPIFANDIMALRQRYGETVSGFHNLIVELLIMAGPLGLITHFTIVFVALYRCFWVARHRDDPYAAWAIMIVLANFGMAMLGPQMYQPHAIPIILTIALGTAFGLPQGMRATGGCPVRHPIQRAPTVTPEFRGIS